MKFNIYQLLLLFTKFDKSPHSDQYRADAVK